QIGCDEPTGTIKGRLAERQKTRIAKQDVESDTEQTPDQDAVHGVGRKSEMRQDEWRRDQAGGGEGFNKKTALLKHQTATLIRVHACRADLAAAAAEPAPLPQTA